jgi:hypothetical protein
MSIDENALAEELSGENEHEQNGAMDPGFESEQEAELVGEEHEPELSKSMQKRLHTQARKHSREMRELRQSMAEMHSMMANTESANPRDYPHPTNPYPSPGQPNPPGMSEDERIQHAVRYALGAKQHEEQQAKDQERQAHVHKQYQRLNDEFDNASDRYDDFDDVVRHEDVPFTPHVRDALLLVENPADVAYKLGKNRKELERISKLHPLDQAREVNKLSFSLMGGNGKPSQHAKTSNPIGNIKANPHPSHGAVTDKTPPSVIRQRMRAGTWK